MAQSEEEIYLLRLAALFHDIGKIGIPDLILLKPGPLTHEEWDLMHRHPDIGRQVLEQAGGIFHPLASIVGTHHERWDGHGYPKGVTKDQIPLGARILAVVDSYTLGDRLRENLGSRVWSEMLVGACHFYYSYQYNLKYT